MTVLITDEDSEQVLAALRAGRAPVRIEKFGARPDDRKRSHPLVRFLTPREREVAGLVGEGLSNDEIGRRLFVSPATARTHVSRAMIKLNARDRAQLAGFALRSGLAA